MVGYTDLNDNFTAADLDKIMSMVDADGNGEIDYSEWIIATVNKKKLLSDDKLQAAFDMFDKDGSGAISPDEIKEVLGIGKKFDDTIWTDIIGEVDDNGDKEISFDEFKDMMVKMMFEP